MSTARVRLKKRADLTEEFCVTAANVIFRRTWTGVWVKVTARSTQYAVRKSTRVREYARKVCGPYLVDTKAGNTMITVYTGTLVQYSYNLNLNRVTVWQSKSDKIEWDEVRSRVTIIGNTVSWGADQVMMYRLDNAEIRNVQTLSFKLTREICLIYHSTALFLRHRQN